MSGATASMKPSIPRTRRDFTDYPVASCIGHPSTACSRWDGIPSIVPCHLWWEATPSARCSLHCGGDKSSLILGRTLPCSSAHSFWFCLLMKPRHSPWWRSSFHTPHPHAYFPGKICSPVAASSQSQPWEDDRQRGSHNSECEQTRAEWSWAISALMRPLNFYNNSPREGEKLHLLPKS